MHIYYQKDYHNQVMLRVSLLHFLPEQLERIERRGSNHIILSAFINNNPNWPKQGLIHIPKDTVKSSLKIKKSFTVYKLTYFTLATTLQYSRIPPSPYN